MRKLEFGSNFALFILFFGVAWLEALRHGNWLAAAGWTAFSLAFLWADQERSRKPRG
jgi:hypothetical protein